MGRRLVADGVIDDREDVLMLTYDDLRVAALDLPGTDPRTLVEQRRAQLALHAGVTAPRRLGTMPSAPPPDSPLMRMAMKSASAGAPSAEPGVVSGSAGSAGRGTGVARGVRPLADADPLPPGGGPLAPTTPPPRDPPVRLA